MYITIKSIHNLTPSKIHQEEIQNLVEPLQLKSLFNYRPRCNKINEIDQIQHKFQLE